MHIQTKIPLSFQKKLRKRGFLFSSIGAIFLFIGANILAIETLENWGIWIFLTAIVFIYIGLKPYKEAKKRIFTPDEIYLENNLLKYFQNQKQQVAIPFESIKSLRFKNTKTQFGIALKQEKKNEVIFFPYFTEESFQKILSHAALQNIMHVDKSH